MMSFSGGVCEDIEDVAAWNHRRGDERRIKAVGDQIEDHGIAGDTWARPVCRVQYLDYIENIGTGGSGGIT